MSQDPDDPISRLTRVVEALTKALADVRRALTADLKRRTRLLWLAVIVIVAVGGTGLVLSWQEPARVRQHTDSRFEQLTRQQAAASADLVRDFCDYLSGQADPDPPPTTERGRLQQQAAARLSQRLGCPGGKR